MSLLEADDASVERRGRKILEELRFTVSPGETLAVLGPNGAGKSTLARLLAGHIAPTSGRIHRAPGLRFGYVPQTINRDATLPVTTKAFLHQGGLRARPKEVDELLETLDLTHLLQQSAAHLSGGELRRLAIARALLRQPDVLLLDEPDAGIDIKTQPIAQRLLANYPKSGARSTILISHDIFAVVPLATRIICLNQHIALDGPPSVIVNADAFAELFGPTVARAAQEILAREAVNG